MYISTSASLKRSEIARRCFSPKGGIVSEPGINLVDWFLLKRITTDIDEALNNRETLEGPKVWEIHGNAKIPTHIRITISPKYLKSY